MADAFGDLLEVDDSLVRKWGRLLVAIEDYSAPVPQSFFTTTDHTPILPPTAKQLGFITTDGVTIGRSVSSTDTNMLQWADPVRSDKESDVVTIACAFGEATNAYVNAVYEGKQVADFPSSPKAPIVVHGGEIDEFPDYRVHLIGVDGVGDKAVYRYLYGYKGKVTATTDRTLARSNPETVGFTLTLSKDAATKRVFTDLQNGPLLNPTP